MSRRNFIRSLNVGPPILPRSYAPYAPALMSAPSVPASSGPIPAPAPLRLVRPSGPLTDAVHVDRSLGVYWQKNGGDWLDKNGTLNGPVPTLSGTGTTATIDTTMFDDLMIVARSVTKVVIDDIDVTAQCVWTASDSNHGIALPSSSGHPVIVPDPVGKLLTFTTTGGPWTVNPLALPSATLPTMVKGYTPPDILRINPTSFDAVVIPGSIPAASTPTNRCFPGVVTYETDHGVPFAKAHCPAVYYPVIGNGRVARCDYPFTPRSEIYMAYLIYLDPSIWDATVDLGVKLSGFGGNEKRWFTGEHTGKYYSAPKNARNRPMIALRDYFYSADALPGQGEGNGQSTDRTFGFLRCPGWTLVEHGAIGNTFAADGTPNQDGVKMTWINGALVENRNIRWFSTPGSLWRQMSMQIYHGGTASYLMDCWYGIGPFMCSSKHIGVDPAFEPLLLAA